MSVFPPTCSWFQNSCCIIILGLRAALVVLVAPLRRVVGGLSSSITSLCTERRSSHETHIHLLSCSGQFLHLCVNHNRACLRTMKQKQQSQLVPFCWLSCYKHCRLFSDFYCTWKEWGKKERLWICKVWSSPFITFSATYYDPGQWLNHKTYGINLLLCCARQNMRRRDHTLLWRAGSWEAGGRGPLLEALGWCLRTQGVVVVCLAVNHSLSDFLCCLCTQCPSATCVCPPSLFYSVGTLLCWWISMFCPWAAERTPAGLLQATSRYRKREKGIPTDRCGYEYIYPLFSEDGRSTKSKMTLTFLFLHFWKTVQFSAGFVWGVLVCHLRLSAVWLICCYNFKLKPTSP